MRILLGFLVLFMAGCDPFEREEASNRDTAHNADIGPDTIRKVLVIDTVRGAISASAPTGIFSFHSGRAENYLHLKDDRTFRLQQADGRTKRISTVSGSWGVNEDQVWLFSGRDTIGKLDIRSDSLIVNTLRSVKLEGKRILLQRHDGVVNDTLWANKRAKGTEFYGIGNEPFWNIEVDDESMTSFRLADWKKAVVQKTPKASTSGDSIQYSFKTPEKTVVTLYRQFCSDGMSDRVYNYKVRVNHKGQTYTGCGEYFKEHK